MRFIRYEDEAGTVWHGVVQPDGSALRIEGDIFGSFEVTRQPAIVNRALMPIAPTNILGIGRNYLRRDHAEAGQQLDFPIVFMKATTAAIGPGADILLPRLLPSADIRYEGELAVVIGRRCKNVSRHDALDYVLAYTCANDLTARDWQSRCGSQWWRAKSFDTFVPLGPCMVGRDEIADPSALRIRTTLNGTVVQDGSTADMIFDVPALIEFLSGETTLLPGTVILTGTPPFIDGMPASSASLNLGDVVAVEITGIGVLTNSVAGEA